MNIIKEHYEEIFYKKIENDFSFYCQAEEYYPPVVEDYENNLSDVLEELCKKHGFELVDWEFEGETSDYIPN